MVMILGFVWFIVTLIDGGYAHIDLALFHLYLTINALLQAYSTVQDVQGVIIVF